jgi:hypothetical protein
MGIPISYRTSPTSVFRHSFTYTHLFLSVFSMKPGPSVLNGKYKQSKTKFGVWASNQAKIAAVLSFFMGAGAILWGGVDPGTLQPGTANYKKDADMNFYRIICGCYSM